MICATAVSGRTDGEVLDDLMDWLGFKGNGGIMSYLDALEEEGPFIWDRLDPKELASLRKG